MQINKKEINAFAKEVAKRVKTPEDLIEFSLMFKKLPFMRPWTRKWMCISVSTMKKKDIEAFAREAAKGIKTEEDLHELHQLLRKWTLETALKAEMEEHLGYESHEENTSSNSRNGYSRKTVQTEDGEFDLDTPRDREGSFNPQIVKKHQRRLTSIDNKILSLYAKGLATREIVDTIKELMMPTSHSA